VLLTTFLINHFELFGLRQVYLYLRAAEHKEVGFRKPFVYKLLRHPLLLRSQGCQSADPMTINRLGFHRFPAYLVGRMMHCHVSVALIYAQIN
jgi:hypothetical protein